MSGILSIKLKGTNQFGEVNSLVTINLKTVSTVTEIKHEAAVKSDFVINLISGQQYCVSKEDAERAIEYLDK
jgi:hypothetical protein